MSRASANPGLGAAVTANRVGMGISANPSLPPGAGGAGAGMPRPSLNLNGTAESTGNPMASAIMKAIAGNAGIGGGHAPKFGGGGKGASIRGLEKPTGARSAAISRRLNGNPSRGTELKGL